MIKLINQKGRPTLKVRHLLDEMNQYLGTMSDENKAKFSNKSYIEDELEGAFEEMKSAPDGISDSEDVTETSQSSTHKSTEPAYEKPAPVDNGSYGESRDSLPDFGDFDPDPNIGDTKDRIYSRTNFDPNVTEIIPEPTFTTEKEVKAGDIPQNNGSGQTPPLNPSIQPEPHQNNGGSQATKPEPIKAANPELNDADEKTKRIAAILLVDQILGGYDQLHEMAKPVVKIKDKKIIDLERKGLIDPKDTITVNAEGDRATLREIVQETNAGIDKTLTPDPTFHATVREPMIREFTKRGVGLTDMQLILLAFGRDIGMKAFQIIAVKRELTNIVDIFKEEQKEKKHQRAQAQRAQNRPNVDSISIPPDENIVDTNDAFEKVTESEEVY